MIEILLHDSGYMAVIDDIDAPKVLMHKWYLYDYKRTYYAQNNHGVKMHALILNCPSNMVRHHKNGNGLDNRRSNLELRTNKQNTRERRVPTNNTTGCMGVKKLNTPTPRPYMARIGVDGTRIYLGTFDNLADAIAARKAAEVKYWK
jgi:HNH endonuclease